MKVNWPKLADVSERTLATFVQAFLAFALATPVSNLTALKAGGIAAGLAAGKYAYVQLNLYLHPDG